MVLEPFSYYNVTDSSFPTRTSSWAPTHTETLAGPVDSVDIDFFKKPAKDDFDERDLAMGLLGREGLMDRLYRETMTRFGKTSAA